MPKKERRSTQQAQLDFGAEPTDEVSGVGGETRIAPETLPTPAETAVLNKKSGRETVWVVDAHSLIYQVFHAIPEMSSPSGQQVGAVHGFTRDMLELIENKQPDYLFCAFDAPGDNFRHELYAEYKIQREAMPIELRPQIAHIRRMLEAMAIPILECPGYEADDILAMIAHQSVLEGRDCYVVTGDKDARQLINDHVFIFNIRKNEVFDAAALKATWGIRPDQVVDFQSLVGDSVDNVPGVPLIGPKIASELLAKYETLEGVFEHVDEIAGQKRKENIKNNQQLALLSRELVRLKIDPPCPFDWIAGRVGGIDRLAVAELCREFGFRQLAQRLGGLSVQEAPAVWDATYTTVTSEVELRRLMEEIKIARRVSIDTETTSVNPRFATIVGYSFAFKPGEGYYVPIRVPAGEPFLSEDIALAPLAEILRDPTIEKLGQNLKYEIIVFRSLGMETANVAFDTMVADYIIDPGERSHNLDDLAKRYLNHANITIDSLIGTGKKQKTMAEVPVDLITQYAAEDADVPLRIESILRRRMEEDGLWNLFSEIEIPLVEVLAELEFNGIRIDPVRLGELSQRYGERMATLETEIYADAGGPFNINSPKQLADILFVKLGLPVIRRTSTGASTDADVLEELAKKHPLPAKIIEYRQNSKLKSGFVDALPTMIHPVTGRVHTSFKQDVAATGRLSSSDPNLQNIPVRNDAGREIRAAFQPGHEGWKLLCADYSQIELRVLAHYSGDAELQRAFFADEDIHSLVASQVYGVPLDQVDRAMRRSAKAINFGVIYGQSAFGLAKALDIPQDEAQRFINAYFAKYQGVEKFMEATLDECVKRGYVTTISGRRRPVHGVRSAASRGTKRQRLLPERIAINSVIQGSAADLIKMAMIRVYRRLKAENWQSKMLLQIHDELVFESPPEELENLRKMVREEMSGVYTLSVPLNVDVKVGDNWGECE